jgi:hypothetical protein
MVEGKEEFYKKADRKRVQHREQRFRTSTLSGDNGIYIQN